MGKDVYSFVLDFNGFYISIIHHFSLNLKSRQTQLLSLSPVRGKDLRKPILEGHPIRYFTSPLTPY